MREESARARALSARPVRREAGRALGRRRVDRAVGVAPIRAGRAAHFTALGRNVPDPSFQRIGRRVIGMRDPCRLNRRHRRHRCGHRRCPARGGLHRPSRRAQAPISTWRPLGAGGVVEPSGTSSTSPPLAGTPVSLEEGRPGRRASRRSGAVRKNRCPGDRLGAVIRAERGRAGSSGAQVTSSLRVFRRDRACPSRP